MKFTGLWRHPDFLRLWSGQTISVFGSMIGGTALSFTAILVLKASPFQMGVLNSMEILPAFLAGLFAGAWVDRQRRRPFLIGADLLRALVLASIPLSALAGLLSFPHVAMAALAVSILSLLFDVAYQSYLPALVGKGEIVEANSKLSASAAVAEFAGFSIGGWLVQVFTAPIAILIDAASFLVSALMVGLIHSPEPPVTREAHPNLRSEIAAGLRAVYAEPLLRAAAAAILVSDLSGGLFGALVVLYMSQGLGFNPGLLGMIWAVGGLSSFAGAALAPRFTRRLGSGPAMMVGLGLFGLSQLLIPLASGATIVSALLLIGQQLGDGFYVLYMINQVSLRQRITPERLQGRVNATMRFLALGASLAGALSGGLLGEILGVRLTLAIGAIGTLLAALVIAISPLKSFKEPVAQLPG